MTLIDFRYKQITSSVTAIAVTPTQRKHTLDKASMLHESVHLLRQLDHVDNALGKLCNLNNYVLIAYPNNYYMIFSFACP